MFIVYINDGNGKNTVSEIHTEIGSITEGKQYIEVDALPATRELLENEIVIGMYVDINANSIFYEYGEKTFDMLPDGEKIKIQQQEIETLKLLVAELGLMVGGGL